MTIEYEATFPNINKEEIRSRLKKAYSVLIYNELIQKRSNFYPPKNNNKDSWLRIREEGNGIITMSFKIVPDRTQHISDQKEISLEIDSYDEAELFLYSLGCKEKSYQETKREAWKLDDVEITINEWPFLHPFVEIEGNSEESVMSVCDKLKFNYNEAFFCNAFYLYSQQYNISIKDLKKRVSGELRRLTFSMDNPFKK